MPDWQKDYKRKATSLENALKCVKSGDRVVVGQCGSTPVPLVDELIRQKERLRDIEIVHMFVLSDCGYCRDGMEKHFRHNSLFAGPGSRKAIKDGRADYTPVFFSEIPRLFKENILPVDVALIQLSPSDERGFLSFGVSADYAKAASETAKIVVAEVNKEMPRTFGSFIHVSEIDYIVETDRPLVEIPLPVITEVEEKIGINIASLVPDGANLQLGIGSIPDAVLKFLKDKRDLGIHSEMFSDGVVELYKAGVITNKYNNLNPGKFIANFLLGTRRLYDFAHDNPMVEIRPVDYTNNILVAGRVNKLISINSALQVDLYGQVCAEMIGNQQFAGVGGQVDFVRAASISEGGKSIIALPSTAKNNTVSRIAAKLDDGSCVTTSRNDVHYVVTEYGIADLRGKSIRQRAEALINIAHPDFREQLKKGNKI